MSKFLSWMRDEKKLRPVAALLLLLALSIWPGVNSPSSGPGAGVAFGQEMSSGDVPDSYFTGEDGTSCDVDPCNGDPCCGDPCCGDPCCGDPCCGDPCCGDPYCGQYCYQVCEQHCGDNETCLWWDECTHTCYLWGDEVCWDECHLECYG
jgi:hypothetical protein